MPQTHYKISEVRKNFAKVLDRANRGEEIIIMRGNEIYARIGPANPAGKRPFGLLANRAFRTTCLTSMIPSRQQSMPAT